MIKKIDTLLFLRHLVFIWFVFLTTPIISFSAQPGIDFDNYGLSTWTGNSGSPYTSLDFWIKIVDYDGIADDGSSHTVKVTYPDNTVRVLNYEWKVNDHTAYYSFWDNTISQPMDPLIYSGDYVFRVEDSNLEWSEATDSLEVNPINPPIETTFSPNFDTTETLTAYFDNVYVNGVLFDDFNSGVFDPAKWDWQPNEVIYENGEVRFKKIYYTSSGSVSFNLKNEEFLDELKATVRADTISGTSSKARIMGNFWQENGVDVYCQVRIQENNATYSIWKDIMLDGHMIGVEIADSTVLGPISQGNGYELSMQWSGSTITFHALGLNDSVDYTDTYSPSGTISLPSDPGARIGIARHLFFNTTTPSLSWDAVPGSEYYRVRFYALDVNWNVSTIYNGYTGTTSFTLPPGILKPNAYYKYRIDSFRDHQWMETDNKAGSDRNKQYIIAGPKETQKPMLDFDSHGVYTWNQSEIGTTTHFYIKIHDAQGVPENIKSVKVLFPDGTTEMDLYHDYNETGTRAIFKNSYYGTVQAGEYIFTVTDKDLNTDAKTDTLILDPQIAYPPEQSLIPLNNTVLDSTALNLDWDDVPGSAFYQVDFYDKDLNFQFRVRNTESEFSLWPGLLKENSLYRYRILTFNTFWEDNQNAGSSSPTNGTWNSNMFFTNAVYGTSAVQIDSQSSGVSLFQALHPNTGIPMHYLSFDLMVQDLDGVPENIKEVTVTYPDGITKLDLKYVDGPDHGRNYYFEKFINDTALIQDTSNSSGIYTFKVTDFDNNTKTFTDALPKAGGPGGGILSSATNIAPVDGTILDTKTPVISWDTVPGAVSYRVRIFNAVGSSTLYWSPFFEETQYTIPCDVLDSDTTYTFRVYAYDAFPDNDIDFLSANLIFWRASYRFTTGDACAGDFNQDYDIDGTDLADFAQQLSEGTALLTIEAFANAFGR